MRRSLPPARRSLLPPMRRSLPPARRSLPRLSPDALAQPRTGRSARPLRVLHPASLPCSRHLLLRRSLTPLHRSSLRSPQHVPRVLLQMPPAWQPVPVLPAWTTLPKKRVLLARPCLPLPHGLPLLPPP